MKLLIVEDESVLSNSIVSFLNQEEDYLCEQAFSFEEAMMKVELYEYDCILLDLMLPGGNGLDVLQKIKQKHSSTGVIIVSARNSLDDKLKGLRLGADDYLAKPFHLPELSMRIYALLRRRNFTNDNIISVGRITINLLSKEVRAKDVILDLTKTEYELLLFLIENRKRVVSKSALAEHLSGDMADMMDDYNFVYAHIKNLKAKLVAVGIENGIKTSYGIGYKWME